MTITETLNSYLHHRTVTPNKVQIESRPGAFLRPCEEMHELALPTKFEGVECWLLYAEQRDLNAQPCVLSSPTLG